MARIAQPSALDALSVDELQELLRLNRKMAAARDVTLEGAAADQA